MGGTGGRRFRRQGANIWSCRQMFSTALTPGSLPGSPRWCFSRDHSPRTLFEPLLAFMESCSLFVTTPGPVNLFHSHCSCCPRGRLGDARRGGAAFQVCWAGCSVSKMFHSAISSCHILSFKGIFKCFWCKGGLTAVRKMNPQMPQVYVRKGDRVL